MDIRPSSQRIMIYDYLRKNRNRSTAEMVFNGFVKSMPSLSKKTVYPTLKLFMETGISGLVLIQDEGKAKDASLPIYGRYTCDSCGKACEFEMDNTLLSLDNSNN